MANTFKLLQHLFLIAASFCLLSSAHAGSLDQAPGATTYIVQNGTLMGIDNLEFNGVFYDVTFKSGSCDSVFSGCNPASMVFYGSRNNINGVNAATALSEAMFYYDQSAPFTTVNGCANQTCLISTPTSFTATSSTVSSSSINEFDIVGNGGLASAQRGKNPDLLMFDIGGSSVGEAAKLPSTQTWAVWTPVTSPVPETQTWAMMAVGVLMLAYAARKANNAR